MNPNDSLPPDTADDNPDNPARTVIAAFGGIRPMAAKLGVPVTTVQGWKKRGVIPANRREEIAAAATSHDIAIADDLLLAAAPDDDDRAGTPQEAVAPAAADQPEAARATPWERPAEPPAESDVRPAETALSDTAASDPTQVDAPQAEPPLSETAADRPTDDAPSTPIEEAPAAAADEAMPSPPPEPPEVHPPPASGSGSARPLAWAAVGLALLAVVAVLSRGQWEPVVWGTGAQSDLADRVATLEAVAGNDPELSGRISQLEERADGAVGQQDAQAEAVAALASEVQTLAGRIDALPSEIGAAEVDALRDQVEALEAAVASGAAGDAGAAIALGERVSALDATVADVAAALSAQGAELEGFATLARDLTAVQRALAGLDSDLAARIEGLEAGVAAVGAQAAAPAPEVLARLDRVEAELAAAAGVVEELERALAGMAAVESRLAALERVGQATDTANAALRDSMADIGRRLDRVNQDIAGLDGGLQGLRDDMAAARAGDVADQALLLALGQVRDAVSSGAPYEAALGALTGLTPSGPETAGALEVLAAHAATGVPTALELVRRFPPMADRVRRAAALPADSDWMDEALASVQGLVTIRRAPGEVAGDDADAVLARAEARLQAGDVAGAVSALESMENPAATDAATQWLDAARGHLAVASAIQTVNGAVLARVAAAGSGTGQ